MKAIDVEGLPEPIARALDGVVQALRVQLPEAEKPREKIKLRTWPGDVIGRLTREEIYEDA